MHVRGVLLSGHSPVVSILVLTRLHNPRDLVCVAAAHTAGLPCLALLALSTLLSALPSSANLPSPGPNQRFLSLSLL